ncbi:anthranilate phosphoribosyltransferase [Bacteroidota bacterium]
MKDILNKLFEHKKLNREEARKVLVNIARNEYSASQTAAFLTVYLMRSISVEELEGFRDALLELCIPVNLNGYETIDMCGTGGDGKNTFNISTLASFIVAGAGYKVAKHGNYGVSSGCGSSNVLEYSGVKFTNNNNVLNKQIDEANICVMHAPLFHPAMKSVAPIRKELKIKTFFNMLGPIVNPSNPKYQYVGVFNLNLARIYQYILQNLGKGFSIVYSLDGYDEVSLTSPFKIINNSTEQIIQPSDLGLKKVKEQDLLGGQDVPSSAKIFHNILNNKGNNSQNSVVLANAALAIKCFDTEKSFENCYSEAEVSLESKSALKSFKKLLEISNIN